MACDYRYDAAGPTLPCGTRTWRPTGACATHQRLLLVQRHGPLRPDPDVLGVRRTQRCGSSCSTDRLRRRRPYSCPRVPVPRSGDAARKSRWPAVPPDSSGVRRAAPAFLTTLASGTLPHPIQPVRHQLEFCTPTQSLCSGADGRLIAHAVYEWDARGAHPERAGRLLDDIMKAYRSRAAADLEEEQRYPAPHLVGVRRPLLTLHRTGLRAATSTTSALPRRRSCPGQHPPCDDHDLSFPITFRPCDNSPQSLDAPPLGPPTPGSCRRSTLPRASSPQTHDRARLLRLLPLPHPRRAIRPPCPRLRPDAVDSGSSPQSRRGRREESARRMSGEQAINPVLALRPAALR